MAAHPLADFYRNERGHLLELGRTLTNAQGSTMTTACPAWSIKDVYAHLAGVTTDILSGNTEGAATEPWANGHVNDRVDHSFSQVLDEWESAGNGVSDLMQQAGELFPFQLFVDQWTHGWDVRAAIGPAAAATRDMTVYTHFIDEFLEHTASNVPAGLPAVTLHVANKTCVLGTDPPIGNLALDLFEYARISMGRRSAAQLGALPWPTSVQDPTPYVDLLVFWSVNDHDVIDPVL